jgi:hypothetical protein
MNYFIAALIVLFVLGEGYYWFWWLPRNWEKTREAEDFKALDSLYGKDGIVWKMMKKGEL